MGKLLILLQTVLSNCCFCHLCKGYAGVAILTDRVPFEEASKACADYTMAFGGLWTQGDYKAVASTIQSCLPPGESVWIAGEAGNSKSHLTVLIENGLVVESTPPTEPHPVLCYYNA